MALARSGSLRARGRFGPHTHISRMGASASGRAVRGESIRDERRRPCQSLPHQRHAVRAAGRARLWPSATKATAARLLKAAARLFRRKGFDATTTRDIAAAVGMHAGSPFYHFKSKARCCTR